MIRKQKPIDDSDVTGAYTGIVGTLFDATAALLDSESRGLSNSADPTGVGSAYESLLALIAHLRSEAGQTDNSRLLKRADRLDQYLKAYNHYLGIRNKDPHLTHHESMEIVEEKFGKALRLRHIVYMGDDHLGADLRFD